MKRNFTVKEPLIVFKAPKNSASIRNSTNNIVRDLSRNQNYLSRQSDLLPKVFPDINKVNHSSLQLSGDDLQSFQSEHPAASPQQISSAIRRRNRKILTSLNNSKPPPVNQNHSVENKRVPELKNEFVVGGVYSHVQQSRNFPVHLKESIDYGGGQSNLTTVNMSTAEIKEVKSDLDLVKQHKQKIKNRVRYLEREEERMQKKMTALRSNSEKHDEITRNKQQEQLRKLLLQRRNEVVMKTKQQVAKL